MNTVPRAHCKPGFESRSGRFFALRFSPLPHIEGRGPHQPYHVVQNDWAIIMMAQNRQNDRDRMQAMADFETNVGAKKEIEALQLRLNQLETDKLDRILKILEEKS